MAAVDRHPQQPCLEVLIALKGAAVAQQLFEHVLHGVLRVGRAGAMVHGNAVHRVAVGVHRVGEHVLSGQCGRPHLVSLLVRRALFASIGNTARSAQKLRSDLRFLKILGEGGFSDFIIPCSATKQKRFAKFGWGVWAGGKGAILWKRKGKRGKRPPHEAAPGK
jgi:hypothetical protein